MKAIRRNFLLQSSKLRTLRWNSTKSTGSICDKLCVLGGGQMAEAIIFALNKKGVQNMNNITVYDVHTERLAFLKKTYGVQITEDVNEATDKADIVLLSVKPQHVESVAQLILNPISGLVLSIVAGYTIKDLQTHFRTSHIVRSMPNTPAMVLEAITVWTATHETPREEVRKARELLGSVGEQIEVKDESYLDMATAVSGSGPAYVFLTMEAMIDAAVHIGFPRETAFKLVTATIKGTATYAQSSKADITVLRSNVTSPGGTTASALYELERGGFRSVIADGIWAAYRRSLELGGNNPNVGPGRSKYNDTKK